MSNNPDFKVAGNEAPISIPKPAKSGLDAFKSTRDPTIAGVETLLTPLPHHKISGAKDWVRLHPDEEKYWTSELCFVNVPILGQKGHMLHLINEELATAHLPSQLIQRFRLALAAKPHNGFFLCHVQSRNLENVWNATNLQACIQAKTKWVQATSRREENVEGYQVSFARDQDAFPETDWLKKILDEIILTTFADCKIQHDEHPGFRRLIGAKQSIA